jgi:hypothetical protein
MKNISRRDWAKIIGGLAAGAVVGRYSSNFQMPSMPQIQLPSLPSAPGPVQLDSSKYDFVSNSLQEIQNQAYSRRVRNAAYNGYSDRLNVTGYAMGEMVKTLGVNPPLDLVYPYTNDDDSAFKDSQGRLQWGVGYLIVGSSILSGPHTTEHRISIDVDLNPNIVLDSLSPQNSPLESLDVFNFWDNTFIQSIVRRQ